MKNTYKLLSIIAMVAVIAFTFTGCGDLDDPDSDGIPKTLIITGVPGDLNGKQLTVALCKLDKNNEPVINALNQVNGSSSVSVPLLSGNEHKKGGNFTGTGDYYVFIFVDTNNTPDNIKNDDTYFYTGSSTGINPANYTIIKGQSSFTIAFNLFKKKV